MKKEVIVTTQEAIGDTFASALGITKEREQELDDLMDKSHEASNTYPDAIAEASKILNNANELAYIAFHMGAFAESQRSKQELLRKLLG